MSVKNVNDYFHIGNPDTSYTVESYPKTYPNSKQYPTQASDQRQDLVNILNNFSSMRFENIGDFFSYYKESYFQTAYINLGINPLGCYQLAMGNPFIMGAVHAISKPIGSADIIAVPNDQNAKPNNVWIDYLENLVNYPNPYTPNNVFMQQLTEDRLQTGNAYVEVNYNKNGFPARLDRVSPAVLEPKQVGGETIYVKENGYEFPEGSLIKIQNPNPLSSQKGLSPLVPLMNHLMLNNALTEHNLRFFTKDMLRGFMNLDAKNMSHKTAVDEAKRIQAEIKNMNQKGEAGHIVTYGATFNMLTTTNRDMLTPEIMKDIMQAVKTIYRVPPLKIMEAIPGSLGGQDETQDDTFNETLIDEMEFTLAYLNFYLLSWAGIPDTHLYYDNLTNTDQERQSKLDTMNLANSTTSIDDVRQARGDDPYNEEWSKWPLIPNNLVPASKIMDINYAEPGTAQASTAGPNTETAYDQRTILTDEVPNHAQVNYDNKKILGNQIRMREVRLEEQIRNRVRELTKVT